MFRLRNINPMARAIGTMGAVAALVGAVTFAQLQTNTVTLAANEMDVTSDVLRISNGGAFSTSVPGFSNTSLVVGNEGPKQAFYFQNLANANLSISADIPDSPTISGLNPALVHIKFYDKDGSTVLANTTFASLNAAPVALSGQLDANAQGNGGISGTEGNYFYTITVDPAAVTGSPANIPSFDLDFSGTSI
ncbi:MAG TPA: hypothetical protein VLF79_00070 [Candidatus Saccharimonadales bacterium]|nr:hypothetical protein [Candidatus Saccharimonadales bacterium]